MSKQFANCAIHDEEKCCPSCPSLPLTHRMGAQSGVISVEGNILTSFCIPGVFLVIPIYMHKD